jgi:glutaminyl-tRNA synthetase
MIQIELLEHHVRKVLNERAQRYMGVMRPLKLVIQNYPDDRVEWFDVPNNPQDPSAGSRRVPFAREIWIERDDFMESAPRKFFRMTPGREVRLRSAYLVTCNDVVRDGAGNLIELRCSYDPATRGGDAPDGRKVRGALHWVSVRYGVPARARLYDRLFKVEFPTDVSATGESGDFMVHLNPESLTTVDDAVVEPALAEASPETSFQLERLGYFCVDAESLPGRLLLNRTLPLRDTWAKVAARPDDT